MSLTALYDVPAPAKLNLFLHVIGKRADGFHLLESVFVLIDWLDTLHFERRADGRLARHDLEGALPQDDLCLRAARALQAESATSLGVDISVAKRLPSGAGMGGGSSDAASTLLALNRLWGLGWSRARLAALGLRLGADVPFFIGGRPAFVQGIGEKLTALDLAPTCYTVVKPSASIATRDIFAHPGLVRDTHPVILEGSPEEAGRSGLPPVRLQEFVHGVTHGFGKNDLQPPAEDRCPEVAQAARWLEARYGNSRMTGSGSAVFARDDMVESPLAAFAVEDLPPGWVVRRCRSLAEHPLVGWAD